MVYPLGYRFLHDLPNKPLTGRSICKILETKEIILKIFKTLELRSLWSISRHKPEAGGFYLDLLLRIHGVSSFQAAFTFVNEKTVVILDCAFAVQNLRS